MLMIFESCSRQSRIENFPCSNFLAISCCLSGLALAMSCLKVRFTIETRTHMCSMRPCTSPMPNNFETKGWGANFSRSLRCSPVPKKMIGVFVAATLVGELQCRAWSSQRPTPSSVNSTKTYAEMAPPPFACPSSFVTIIAPKSALSLKARLWPSAA